MNLGRDMYFSVDIECDGPAPGTSSMLSIGVVAYDPVTLENCGEFYRTLKRLPDARPDNDTMNWWDAYPKQWVEARANAEEPVVVMQALHDWVVEKGKQAKRQHNMEKGPIPVFVAYPASFDFSFFYYYAHRFVGDSVFSFSALDLKSLAMGMLGIAFTSKKETYPEEWTSPLPITHNALEDARSQGDWFKRMLHWRDGRTLLPVGRVPVERIDGQVVLTTNNGVIVVSPDAFGPPNQDDGA